MNTAFAIIDGTHYSILNGTLANGTAAPDDFDSGVDSLHVSSWTWITIVVGIALHLLV